jgi:hypothetical protein
MVEIPLAEVETMPFRQREVLNRMVGVGPLKLYAERHSDAPDSIFVHSREDWDQHVEASGMLIA